MTIERLRELEKAATPGPWWGDVDGFGTIFAGSTEYNAETHDDQPWLYDPRDATRADAALIAEARNHLSALLDVAEAARAQPQYNKKALREALARLDVAPEEGAK